MNAPWELLIKGARTPDGICDVAVQDGVIAALGSLPAASARTVIEADGLWLLPGGIDPHTHLNLTAGGQHVCDGWTAGSKAALTGGTTTVIEHISFAPAGSPCPAYAALDQALIEAEGQSCCDYALHGVAQRVDAELLRELKAERERGIVSWKAYTTYGDPIFGADLERLLAACREAGVLLTVHCEDDAVVSRARAELAAVGHLSPACHPFSRPAAAEATAIRELLAAAHRLGDAPVYVVHLSTAAGLAEIRAAKARGQQNIYAETCSQYLLLDESCYRQGDDLALKAAISPPLRTRSDREALWQGVTDGTIDTLATDHCAFSLAQKQRGRQDLRLTPNGAPGVGERVPLLLDAVVSGRLTLTRAVELLSAAPARIFGLPTKGRLAVGCDADLVLFDPCASWRVPDVPESGGTEYSLYAGRTLAGRIKAVWLRGQQVLDGSRMLASAGQGNYIRRSL